jgi:hypothetical protein
LGCAAFDLRLSLLCVRFIGVPERFQFYDPGLVPYSPRDDLFRMFPVIGFDDCPAAVRAVVTAPFEVMQIPRGMDLFDDGVTFACIVW